MTAQEIAVLINSIDWWKIQADDFIEYDAHFRPAKKELLKLSKEEIFHILITVIESQNLSKHPEAEKIFKENLLEFKSLK